MSTTTPTTTTTRDRGDRYRPTEWAQRCRRTISAVHAPTDSLQDLQRGIQQRECEQQQDNTVEGISRRLVQVWRGSSSFFQVHGYAGYSHQWRRGAQVLQMSGCLGRVDSMSRGFAQSRWNSTGEQFARGIFVTSSRGCRYADMSQGSRACRTRMLRGCQCRCQWGC